MEDLEQQQPRVVIDEKTPPLKIRLHVDPSTRAFIGKTCLPRAPGSPAQHSRRQQPMTPRHRKDRIATPQPRVGRRNHDTTRYRHGNGGEYERHRGTPTPPLPSLTPGGFGPSRPTIASHPVARPLSVRGGTFGEPWRETRGEGRLGLPHPSAPTLAHSRDPPFAHGALFTHPRGGNLWGANPPNFSTPWRAHLLPPHPAQFAISRYVVRNPNQRIQNKKKISPLP